MGLAESDLRLSSINVPFIYIVWAVGRHSAGSRFSKAVNLCGLASVTFGIGILIGNVLDPWLFPKR
jgi:hypothetical protein